MPFLQVVLGEFRFVPILMGDQSRSTCESLAGAIIPYVSDGKTLLVASSDLSHYRPYDSAVKIDRRVLERIEQMDAEGLLDDLESGRAEACGGGPIAVAMMVSKSIDAKNRPFEVCNSECFRRPFRWVVCFGFSRKCNHGKKRALGTASGLSEEEKPKLLLAGQDNTGEKLLETPKLPGST